MATVRRAGVEEADAAVARAKAAYPAWRAVAPPDRARLLARLSAVVEEHGEELAVLEARNAGKPIGDARGEIGMSPTSSATKRARRSGCSAPRAPWPAGTVSRCGSRSAWSG